jgi:hypothetical protein
MECGLCVEDCRWNARAHRRVGKTSDKLRVIDQVRPLLLLIVLLVGMLGALQALAFVVGRSRWLSSRWCSPSWWWWWWRMSLCRLPLGVCGADWVRIAPL